MKKFNVIKLVLAAMFLALGITLPFLTGQLKEIGDSLLPMHLPVLLCGALCGPWYGLFVGLCTPLLRSVLFSMPKIYPNAVWMALELATYGLVLGLMYKLLKSKGVLGVYISLITAMLSGRIVWGVAKAVLLGVGGKAFTLSAFWVGGFVDALPGIVIQLILVPTIIKIVEKYVSKKEI